MLTRRTFLTSAAVAMAVSPNLARLQSREPNPERWPEIQSAAVDQRRTRIIGGDGLRTAPGDVVHSAIDLEFAQTRDHDPTMALANDFVLARALGPDLPLVAFDARTGEEQWRRNRVTKLLGAAGNLAVSVVDPESDRSLPVLKGSRLDTGSDIWGGGAGEIHGAVIVNSNQIVYSQTYEEKQLLISRVLVSGESQWSQEITGFDTSPPEIFASNGKVVVGRVRSSYTSRHIAAWRVDSGEPLWTMDAELFLSSPAFHGDDVVMLTEEGLLRIQADSGEVVETVEVPPLGGQSVSIAITESAAILMSYGEIRAVSWEDGETSWSRRSVMSRRTDDFLVCDGMILQLENKPDGEIGDLILRGYDRQDGRLAYAYALTGEAGPAPQAASFLVGNGHLYIGTDQGLMTVLPGDGPPESPDDPAYDRAFENQDLGFRYTWDDEWESTGTSFMTPNGQTFFNDENGSVASQSAGPAKDRDITFMNNWHANLGPDDRYIKGILEVDAPQLDFVPDSATVLGVEYESTFNAPYDQLFGVRVLIPLADDNVLTFEYMQAESLVGETIGSFATFFEELEIGPISDPNDRHPDSD